jgi:hypothetical protein
MWSARGGGGGPLRASAAAFSDRAPTRAEILDAPPAPQARFDGNSPPPASPPAHTAIVAQAQTNIMGARLERIRDRELRDLALLDYRDHEIFRQ